MFTKVHDNSLNVCNVFSLELLAASSRVCRAFEGAVEGYAEEIKEAMGDKLVGYDLEDMGTLEIMGTFGDLDIEGFLVEFDTRVPVNFSFNDDGSYRSYSESNSVVNGFFYGVSVEECLNKAVEWRKEIVSVAAESERK